MDAIYSKRRYEMRPDLAACYGQERLPRYTSYPTAPHFSGAIGPETYAEWLKAIPRCGSASLYLHVPFCRSMCWYCGCHTTIARHDEPISLYAAALRCELDLVSKRIERRIKVDHIHFGGGTPTIMAPELFLNLIGSIRQAFFVVPSAEIAVEIDPRTLTTRMVDALAYGGVNRASLGVQSFDPVVQRAINRVQSFEETAEAVRSLRRAGIAGINFDLIYGLPYQTVASCLDSVRRCVELRPDRFSVFGYAHVPTFKKYQRKIAEAWLPDSLERLDQSYAIANALKEAGYLQIGLDHFALPGDAMAAAQREGRLRRNFQGYTTDTSNVLLGFGASAIGQLPQGYVQNEVNIRAYSRNDRRRQAGDGQGLRLDRRRSAARRDHRTHHVRFRRRPRPDLRAARIGAGRNAEILAPPAGSGFLWRGRTRRRLSGGEGGFALPGPQRRGRLRRPSRRIEATAQPGGVGRGIH